MVLHTVKLYKNKSLYWKYTVEELQNGSFIATSWDVMDCFEEDRHVKEFETYSAALALMYRDALKKSVELSDDAVRLEFGS